MAWSSRLLFVLSWLLLAPGVLSGAASVADPASDFAAQRVAARQVVESFHAQLVQLAAEADPDLESRVVALRPVVDASHDLSYIARFTLRRQWGELSESQRAAFVQAFSELSVTTYATRFDAVTPATFTIVEVTAAGRGRIQVAAAINRPDGEPIPLSYLLHLGDEGWRIINIIADGVSDLALKRAEYQRVFAAEAFPGLLAHLQQLTATLGESPS